MANSKTRYTEQDVYEYVLNSNTNIENDYYTCNAHICTNFQTPDEYITYSYSYTNITSYKDNNEKIINVNTVDKINLNGTIHINDVGLSYIKTISSETLSHYIDSTYYLLKVVYPTDLQLSNYQYNNDNYDIIDCTENFDSNWKTTPKNVLVRYPERKYINYKVNSEQLPQEPVINYNDAFIPQFLYSLDSNQNITDENKSVDMFNTSTGTLSLLSTYTDNGDTGQINCQIRKVIDNFFAQSDKPAKYNFMIEKKLAMAFEEVEKITYLNQDIEISNKNSTPNLDENQYINTPVTFKFDYYGNYESPILTGDFNESFNISLVEILEDGTIQSLNSENKPFEVNNGKFKIELKLGHTYRLSLDNNLDYQLCNIKNKNNELLNIMNNVSLQFEVKVSTKYGKYLHVTSYLNENQLNNSQGDCGEQYPSLLDYDETISEQDNFINSLKIQGNKLYSIDNIHIGLCHKELKYKVICIKISDVQNNNIKILDNNINNIGLGSAKIYLKQGTDIISEIPRNLIVNDSTNNQKFLQNDGYIFYKVCYNANYTYTINIECDSVHSSIYEQIIFDDYDTKISNVVLGDLIANNEEIFKNVTGRKNISSVYSDPIYFLNPQDVLFKEFKLDNKDGILKIYPYEQFYDNSSKIKINDQLQFNVYAQRLNGNWIRLGIDQSINSKGLLVFTNIDKDFTKIILTKNDTDITQIDELSSDNIIYGINAELNYEDNEYNGHNDNNHESIKEVEFTDGGGGGGGGSSRKSYPNFYWTYNYGNHANDVLFDVTVTISQDNVQENPVLPNFIWTTPNISQISFSSTNNNIATVDNNGIVNITGLQSGKVQIWAKVENNSLYYSLSRGFNLTVNIISNEVISDIQTADPEYYWSMSEVTYTNLNSTLPVLENPNNIPNITFNSTNPDIATIDNDGIITINSNNNIGSTIIYASNEEYTVGNKKYLAHTECFVLNVEPDNINPTHKIWTNDEYDYRFVYRDPNKNYNNNEGYSDYIKCETITYDSQNTIKLIVRLYRDLKDYIIYDADIFNSNNTLAILQYPKRLIHSDNDSIRTNDGIDYVNKNYFNGNNIRNILGMYRVISNDFPALLPNDDENHINDIMVNKDGNDYIFITRNAKWYSNSYFTVSDYTDEVMSMGLSDTPHFAFWNYYNDNDTKRYDMMVVAANNNQGNVTTISETNNLKFYGRILLKKEYDDNYKSCFEISNDTSIFDTDKKKIEIIFNYQTVNTSLITSDTLLDGYTTIDLQDYILSNYDEEDLSSIKNAISFSSSDNNIAEINGNKISLKSIGVVQIIAKFTATSILSGKYESSSEKSYTLIISESSENYTVFFNADEIIKHNVELGDSFRIGMDNLYCQPENEYILNKILKTKEYWTVLYASHDEDPENPFYSLSTDDDGYVTIICNKLNYAPNIILSISLIDIPGINIINNSGNTNSISFHTAFVPPQQVQNEEYLPIRISLDLQDDWDDLEIYPTIIWFVNSSDYSLTCHTTLYTKSDIGNLVSNDYQLTRENRSNIFYIKNPKSEGNLYDSSTQSFKPFDSIYIVARSSYYFCMIPRGINTTHELSEQESSDGHIYYSLDYLYNNYVIESLNVPLAETLHVIIDRSLTGLSYNTIIYGFNQFDNINNGKSLKKSSIRSIEDIDGDITEFNDEDDNIVYGFNADEIESTQNNNETIKKLRNLSKNKYGEYQYIEMPMLHISSDADLETYNYIKYSSLKKNDICNLIYTYYNIHTKEYITQEDYNHIDDGADYYKLVVNNIASNDHIYPQLITQEEYSGYPSNIQLNYLPIPKGTKDDYIFRPKLRILSEGETIIYATYDGDNKYGRNKVSFRLIVKLKGQPSLSLDQDTYEIEKEIASMVDESQINGDELSSNQTFQSPLPSIICEEEIPVEYDYSSSNNLIVEHKDGGLMCIYNVGTVKINIKLAESEKYKSAEISYKLNIKEPAPKTETLLETQESYYKVRFKEYTDIPIYRIYDRYGLNDDKSFNHSDNSKKHLIFETNSISEFINIKSTFEDNSLTLIRKRRNIVEYFVNPGYITYRFYRRNGIDKTEIVYTNSRQTRVDETNDIEELFSQNFIDPLNGNALLFDTENIVYSSDFKTAKVCLQCDMVFCTDDYPSTGHDANLFGYYIFPKALSNRLKKDANNLVPFYKRTTNGPVLQRNKYVDKHLLQYNFSLLNFINISKFPLYSAHFATYGMVLTKTNSNGEQYNIAYKHIQRSDLEGLVNNKYNIKSVPFHPGGNLNYVFFVDTFNTINYDKEPNKLLVYHNYNDIDLKFQVFKCPFTSNNTDDDVEYTFTSSVPSIAKPNENGNVVIYGIGKVKIMIRSTETDNFTSGECGYILDIVDKEYTILDSLYNKYIFYVTDDKTKENVYELPKLTWSNTDPYAKLVYGLRIVPHFENNDDKVIIWHAGNDPVEITKNDITEDDIKYIHTEDIYEYVAPDEYQDNDNNPDNIEDTETNIDPDQSFSLYIRLKNAGEDDWVNYGKIEDELKTVFDTAIENQIPNLTYDEANYRFLIDNVERKYYGPDGQTELTKDHADIGIRSIALQLSDDPTQQFSEHKGGAKEIFRVTNVNNKIDGNIETSMGITYKQETQTWEISMQMQLYPVLEKNTGLYDDNNTYGYSDDNPFIIGYYLDNQLDIDKYDKNEADMDDSYPNYDPATMSRQFKLNCYYIDPLLYNESIQDNLGNNTIQMPCYSDDFLYRRILVDNGGASFKMSTVTLNDLWRFASQIKYKNAAQDIIEQQETHTLYFAYYSEQEESINEEFEEIEENMIMYGANSEDIYWRAPNNFDIEVSPNDNTTVINYWSNNGLSDAQRKSDFILILKPVSGNIEDISGVTFNYSDDDPNNYSSQSSFFVADDYAQALEHNGYEVTFRNNVTTDLLEGLDYNLQIKATFGNVDRIIEVKFTKDPVIKQNPNIYWENSYDTWTCYLDEGDKVDKPWNRPDFKNPNNIDISEISFTSSNLNIGSVDTNGNVEITNSAQDGDTFKITASFGGNDTYNSTSVDCTINIKNTRTTIPVPVDTDPRIKFRTLYPSMFIKVHPNTLNERIYYVVIDNSGNTHIYYVTLDENGKITYEDNNGQIERDLKDFVINMFIKSIETDNFKAQYLGINYIIKPIGEKHAE